MILVDNSKKAGAVAHLVSLPSLECCPPQIQQVFDAQRQTQFCSFVDDVLHLWIGLGDEESMTLSHVKNAAAAMAKAMRRMKQTEYQVDCADVVKLFGIDSVYHLTTGIALGLYAYFLPLPIMLFELLVAFIQATVFMMLTIAYISSASGEEH